MEYVLKEYTVRSFILSVKCDFFQAAASFSMTKATHDVDTGYSWLILISDTSLVFLTEGLRKSLSVMLPTLKDQFETQTWLIGIMIALTHGVKDFLGRSYVQFL